MCITRGTEAHPKYCEDVVRDLIKNSDKCKLEVIADEQLLENGMNLFHAVGRCAVVPPRCVIVKYMGNPDSDEIETAFIGKGVTHDSGGLNLKMHEIERMHGDKGGACAIVGALKGTIDLQIKKNLVFAFAFADNGIGANAFKPGDIIKSMKGLFVEIGNTDAEGRLVLADTMTYVQAHYKPKRIIDLATLTGAIIIALGMETGGMFCDDADLLKELKKASADSFEAMWRMPITDEHRQNMKGKYSDLNNLSYVRFGGSCTAAAFLENFIDKDVAWCHMDIAGPAECIDHTPPISADQTGFGASLLLHYLT